MVHNEVDYMTKKLTIYMLLFMAITLILAVAFGIFLRCVLSSRYEDAISALRDKHYTEAIQSFEELGNYKESEKYLEEAKSSAKYQEAMQLFQDEKYLDAYEIFTSLDTYEDSKQYAEDAQLKYQEQQNDISYQEALQLYKEGKYPESYEIFISLGTYKESGQYAAKAQLADQERLKEIVYQEAMRLYSEGYYEDAVNEFNIVGDYKDSLDKQHECEDIIKRASMAHSVSAGMSSVLGINQNQSVLYTNGNYQFNFSNWDGNDIVSVAIGDAVAAGLKADGTVVAKVGSGAAVNVSDASDWEHIVAIAAGERFIAALTCDGRVVATGHNGDNQTDVADWPDNIVAIAAGWRHTVGLDKNGGIHITGFGSNAWSQKLRNLIDQNASEWTSVTAIDAGGGGSDYVGFIVGLKVDGTVAVAYDEKGPYKDYQLNQVENWTDIVAIAAGEWHIVGLDKNGKVWSTCPDPNAGLMNHDNTEPLFTKCCDVSDWEDIVAISAGSGITVGIKEDGSVVARGFNSQGQVTGASSWTGIIIY